MDTLQIEEQSKTKFNSPLPFLLQFRDLLFGKKTPDGYTQVTFYMNLILWGIFFTWSLVSYFVITLREFIYTEKNIPVEEIIRDRGVELGFDPFDFLDKLLTFHAVSIVCWLISLIGLILLWRKNLKFIYFFMGGTIFYFGMILFFLNFTYFREDMTLFDKIAFLAMNSSVLLYYFLLRKEKKGGSISFFGEEEDQ